MKRDSEVFRLLSSVLLGISAGILMAAVLLFLFTHVNRVNDPVTLVCFAAVASVLPMCLDRITARGLSPLISECVMIGLSLLISLLYSSVSAGNEAAEKLMTHAAVMVHLSAFAVLLIRVLADNLSGKHKENV